MGNSQNLHKQNYLQLQFFQVFLYPFGADLKHLIALQHSEHKLTYINQILGGHRLLYQVVLQI